MIWSNIKGYEKYKISSSGIVYNTITGNRLKGYLNSNRQKCLTLCKNGIKKNFVLDRLIFEHFDIKLYFPNYETNKKK